MYENTRGRVTFLVDLMFRRLGKFDGPIFREKGACVQNVNWVTYVGYICVYSDGILTGFYSIPVLKA